MQIYYDIRINEWVTDLDVAWLAPELYFEIKESPDDKQYHEFMTDQGLVSFSSTDNNDFQSQMSEIEKTKKILYRVSWSLPKAAYEEGIEYFNL